MLYTQALVPGYRVVVQAARPEYAYHAGAQGQPTFCPPERVGRHLHPTIASDKKKRPGDRSPGRSGFGETEPLSAMRILRRIDAHDRRVRQPGAAGIGHRTEVLRSRRQAAESQVDRRLCARASRAAGALTVMLPAAVLPSIQLWSLNGIEPATPQPCTTTV